MLARYNFYADANYKKKQSERTRQLWKDGKYNSLIKPLEKRICKNPICDVLFEVTLGSPKIYCTRHCSVQVNNNKRVFPLNGDELSKLYSSGLSMTDISKKLHISVHKVVYWMEKNKIPRRTLSDAIYLKHNPNGDPFTFTPPSTPYGIKLYGLGLGLYWGEGNKANLTAVKLGNTDPELLKTFIEFLEKIYGVKKQDLKFGLQIFTDIDKNEALSYWMKKLNAKTEQFYKTVVTISGSLGTYRHKSKYGVITVHYHNKKLRDMLVNSIPFTFNY